jgi:adenylate cyclase
LAEQVLVASPRNKLAHFVKGQVLREQDKYTEAIPEYETAIASDPNFASAYANLGLCKLLIGSIDEGLLLEEKAIRLDPHNPFVRA